MCIAKNEREWICPERLQMGDTIGFVAPCCVLQKRTRIRRGAYWKEWDFV